MTAPATSITRSIRKLRRRQIFRRRLAVFAVLIFVAALLLGTVFRPVKAATRAMLPTIAEGQTVFVNVLDHTPLRKDLILLTRTDPDGSPMIRRVTALPGDEVARREDGSLTVNGAAACAPMPATSDMAETVSVPEGYVFVVCDNPAEGIDSRSSQMGLIALTEIKGIVW